MAVRTGTGVVAAAARLPPSGLLLLGGLTLFWGLNWPFMKLALVDIPPWTFRTLCLMGGGSLLLALTRLWGERIALAPRVLPVLAVTGLFNITGWHLFSAYGVLNTGAGRAAIVGYTMPLWASLFSVLFLRVPIGLREITALGFGIAALVLLVHEDLARLGAAPVGTGFMTGAAISWAIGTILVKRFAPWPMPVTALTAWQLLLGGAPILLGAALLEGAPAPSSWGWPAIFGVTYAITIAMVFCHTAYFKLVDLLPAHVAAISVLATPVVGVVSSALVLGEAIGPSEIAALGLVVTGLFLLMRRSRG